jgi:hypothetical protein
VPLILDSSVSRDRYFSDRWFNIDNNKHRMKLDMVFRLMVKADSLDRAPQPQEAIMGCRLWYAES